MFKNYYNQYVHQYFNKLIISQMNLGNNQPINAAGRVPPYTIFTFEGINYRILTRQHTILLQTLNFWGFSWFFVGLIMLGSAGVIFFELKIPYILIVIQSFLFMFTILGFIKKNEMTQSIFYSSINLLICLIPAIVLAFMEIQLIIIPFCFYVTIQIFISVKFMSNKSLIIGKFFIFMQLILITLKVDQKLQKPWRDILAPHAIFFIFLSMCVLFMLGYLFYMKFSQNNQNLMRAKFPGAFFLLLNFTALCLISAYPLSYIFLKIQMWISCFSLAFAFFALGGYTILSKNQIVIFFCTLNEIKSFDQVISFQPIQGIKNNKIQDCNQNSFQTMYLYRLSQNWMTKNPQKFAECQQENPQVQKQNINDSSKLTDCTICMDRSAEVVWMPCGHLTVCVECCSFMFQNKNFNCVLCKKTPQQIFMIQITDSKENQNIEDPKKLNISAFKDDSSQISSDMVLQMERRKQMTSSMEELTKQKPFSLKNKKQYKVLEGYNVKII